MLSNKKTIIPTSYFGSILYYKILTQNNCKIEINDFFIKQTIRNRCEILGPNKILKLSVPCKKNKEKTLTKNIKISYDENWQKIHLKSIEYSYRSSPYFEYYENIIKKIFNKKYEFLIDLNFIIHEKMLQCLNIKIKNTHTSCYKKHDRKSDLRNFDFFTKTKFKKYNQVFNTTVFYSNLCILDLIFNLGPDANKYLQEN